MLDKAAVPLSRLWCLYELAQTDLLGRDLQLLTHNFDLAVMASLFKGLDVKRADCFSQVARAVIHADIVKVFGSLEKMTQHLKLILGKRLAEELAKHALPVGSSPRVHH